MKMGNLEYEIPQKYAERFKNVLEYNYSCTLYSLTKIRSLKNVGEEQIREILHFLENRATTEQIDFVEKCGFNPKKMRAIRKSLELGVPFEEIKKIPWKDLDEIQCDIVYTGFASGFSKEEMSLISNQKLPEEIMIQIVEASSYLPIEKLKMMAEPDLSVEDVIFLREQLEMK